VKPIDWTAAEREAVRDELAGTPIGTGYYSTAVGIDEAHDMADEVLDALAPFVADRERQAAARALYHASHVAKRRESGDVSWLTLRAMAYNVRAKETTP